MEGVFNLRWNDFEANTRVLWRELREEKEFLDVTLVAGDGRQVKANKVILAAGSVFFHQIITENPHPHPLIYLKGVSYKNLLWVLDFLYTGEARIAEENLNQFLDVAEDLKIKGLTPPALQTKSHPSSTAPPQIHGTTQDPGPSPSSTTPQGQGTTEDRGPSLRSSNPRSATSTAPAYQGQKAMKENTTSASISHHSVISVPLHDQLAAEEAALSPRISRHHNVISSHLQDQMVTKENAPLPRVSRPPSVITSERDNTLSQVICEESQDNISYVKVEVSEAAQDNVFYGTKDGEPFIKHVSVENLHDNKENNNSFKRKFPEQCETYQNEGIGLSGKQDQHFSKKPKVELMNSEQIHDWYEHRDENTMIPDGKGDDYFAHEWDECNTEKEDYVGPPELEKNKMSHSENPLQCSVCNKVFSKRSNLNLHRWTHAEKQFQCLVCFKRFTRSDSLNKHKRIHTDEKPYQCSLCSKKFSYVSNLYQHMRKKKKCSMKL